MNISISGIPPMPRQLFFDLLHKIIDSLLALLNASREHVSGAKDYQCSCMPLEVHAWFSSSVMPLHYFDHHLCSRRGSSLPCSSLLPSNSPFHAQYSLSLVSAYQG